MVLLELVEEMPSLLLQWMLRVLMGRVEIVRMSYCLSEEGIGLRLLFSLVVERLGSSSLCVLLVFGGWLVGP